MPTLDETLQTIVDDIVIITALFEPSWSQKGRFLDLGWDVNDTTRINSI
jgi:hypothetical protein